MPTNHRRDTAAIHRLPQPGQILRWRNFIILSSSNHSSFRITTSFHKIAHAHSHSISNRCHWTVLPPAPERRTPIRQGCKELPVRADSDKLRSEASAPERIGAPISVMEHQVLNLGSGLHLPWDKRCRSCQKSMNPYPPTNPPDTHHCVPSLKSRGQTI